MSCKDWGNIGLNTPSCHEFVIMDLEFKTILTGGSFTNGGRDTNVRGKKKHFHYNPANSDIQTLELVSIESLMD